MGSLILELNGVAVTPIIAASSKYLNNFSNCRYDIYYNCSSCGKKIDL